MDKTPKQSVLPEEMLDNVTTRSGPPRTTFGALGVTIKRTHPDEELANTDIPSSKKMKGESNDQPGLIKRKPSHGLRRYMTESNPKSDSQQSISLTTDPETQTQEKSHSSHTPAESGKARVRLYVAKVSRDDNAKRCSNKGCRE